MTFGLGKLQVVEQKLEIYEDLTRQMLVKLESAVEKIAEANIQTNLLLERHENRLDEGERSNTLIVKMVEELKEVEKNDISVLHKKVSTIHNKVEQNHKFVFAAGAVLTTMMAVSQLFGVLGWTLTTNDTSVMLEKTSSTYAVS